MEGIACLINKTKQEKNIAEEDILSDCKAIVKLHSTFLPNYSRHLRLQQKLVNDLFLTTNSKMINEQRATPV